jgi:hypothetical protein
MLSLRTLVTAAMSVALGVGLALPACGPFWVPPAEPRAAASSPVDRAPPPSVALLRASIRVHPGKIVRTFDKRRLLGSNVAIWHRPATFADPRVRKALVDAGIGLLRMPGGSASDQYFWNGNGVRQGDQVDRSKYRDHRWEVDYSTYQPGFLGFWGFPPDAQAAELKNWHGNVDVRQLHEFIRAVKADTLVTVNAGTGTAKDAAEWVRWANQIMRYGVRYWEVGNELGGGWESGTVRADGRSMDGAMYGGIYAEFARAMKAVDPNIWVGSQGGVDFIRGALAEKAPVDFVTFHDYFNAKSTSIEARFATLDRIRPAIAEIRKAIAELRPGSHIEVGMTEYNCKLFEDEETSDVLSGLWMVAAVGEMLYGGLDFATQWDAFTQKPESGGGHGFMLEEGAVPKAAYWALYLLQRFLGRTLVEVESSTPALRTYASTDDRGGLYLVAVNTHPERPALAQVDLGGTIPAPLADGMRFSYREYAWDKQAFRPLYNRGPSAFRARVAASFAYELPAFSATALHFERAAGQPVLGSEGANETTLRVGKSASIPVAVFDAQGRAVAGVTVAAQVAGGFRLASPTVTTGPNGVAAFVVTAPERPGSARVQWSAPGYPNAEHAVSAVVPSLELHGPTRCPVGETASFLALVRYPVAGGHRLLDSLTTAGAYSIGTKPEQRLSFDAGFGRFQLSCADPASEVLRASVDDLKRELPLEFYATAEQNVTVLRFDDQASFAGVSGKAEPRLDEGVRPNQGVLRATAKGIQGWTQDFVNFDLKNQLKLDRANIVAVSFDLMPAKDLDLGGQWAKLVVVLQSELDYWMPLTDVDLGSLPRGEWTRVTLPIPREKLPTMKAFFKIITIINSGGKVSGSLYFDDLGLKVRVPK